MNEESAAEIARLQSKLADEHLSLQAASEFIRDVHEALHGVRPGQEDTLNLIELAEALKKRVPAETGDDVYARGGDRVYVRLDTGEYCVGELVAVRATGAGETKP